MEKMCRSRRLEALDGLAQDPEVVMHQGIPRMVKILEDPQHAFWEETERRIVAENPDLVGITCNSGNMDTARILVGRLKGRGVPVILGGSHPTVLPEQSFNYTGADMAAIGEGELTLVRVMDALHGKGSLSDIPSLAWRKDGRIIVNPRADLIAEIDSLPIPDRSFISRSEYFGEVLLTGRGCPFNCASLRFEEHLGPESPDEIGWRHCRRASDPQASCRLGTIIRDRGGQGPAWGGPV